MAAARLVLGSTSPQRRELLRHLLPADAIRIVPPTLAREPGFDDVRTLDEVDARLLEIARLKNDDVRSQLLPSDRPAVLTADTAIVAFEPDGRPVILGKPPEEARERDRTVREWFARYYLGRRHLAKTGLCLTTFDGTRLEKIVTTEVWFAAEAEAVEWYLRTGEPAGKAGGYGLQGAASLFVDRVEGSLSNVVGLPLRETRELLRRVGLDGG